MADNTYNGRIISPVVSIKETEKEVVIEAEMTGLSKEDISLEVKGDELTLRGLRKGCDEPSGYTALWRERCPFEYARTFILGDEVRRDGINARYENGVLSVTVPKAEKVQPKKIQITD
ncbi:MAG TPA: Hsp20/alpha crystallin family protein [Candidatus Omnitrophota bacterium]|nr:Hsp20/alpha crystallin family protein [Candidatus Omnitrophota bacterium]